MRAYLCRVCGHLLFNRLLTKCPKCGADNKEFNRIDDYLTISRSKSFQIIFRKKLFEHKLNSFLE